MIAISRMISSYSDLLNFKIISTLRRVLPFIVRSILARTCVVKLNDKLSFRHRKGVRWKIDVPIPGFPDYGLGIPKEFLRIWNSLGIPHQIPIPDIIFIYFECDKLRVEDWRRGTISYQITRAVYGTGYRNRTVQYRRLYGTSYMCVLNPDKTTIII
jgi:hypothetical protein